MRNFIILLMVVAVSRWRVVAQLVGSPPSPLSVGPASPPIGIAPGPSPLKLPPSGLGPAPIGLSPIGPSPVKIGPAQPSIIAVQPSVKIGPAPSISLVTIGGQTTTVPITTPMPVVVTTTTTAATTTTSSDAPTPPPTTSSTIDANNANPKTEPEGIEAWLIGVIVGASVCLCLVCAAVLFFVMRTKRTRQQEREAAHARSRRSRSNMSARSRGVSRNTSRAGMHRAPNMPPPHHMHGQRPPMMTTPHYGLAQGHPMATMQDGRYAPAPTVPELRRSRGKANQFNQSFGGSMYGGSVNGGSQFGGSTQQYHTANSGHYTAAAPPSSASVSSQTMQDLYGFVPANSAYGDMTLIPSRGPPGPPRF